MYRVVLIAPIQPGHEDEIREVLRAGPPFDLQATSLHHHQVFLAEDRVVFVFEGPHADQEIERLLNDSEILGAAGHLAEHLASGPRFAEESFTWERVAELDGLSFGAQPGPGDSDGGPG